MSEKKILSKRKKDVDLLTCAFQDFTHATETLRKSYALLQQKITELTDELAETNKALSRKVSELNKVQAYLNNTLDSMMSGLVAVDLEGKITIFNKAAEEITGLRAKDVLGKSCKDVFGKDNKEFFSILSKAFKRRESVVGERAFFSSGKSILLEVIVNPVINPKGEKDKIEGFVTVFRDISMLKHLQEEVRRREKLALVGEMAAGIAHEIKNPVSGIEGFALLLKESLEENDGRRKWVDNIIKGAQCLNNLVTNLLNFSRPLKMNFQFASINELIESTISFVEQKIRREKLNIRIIKELPSQSIRVLADSNLLRQVFLNLSINAIEAMPEGGRLTVCVRERSYPKSEIHQFIREIDGDYTLNTLSLIHI